MIVILTCIYFAAIINAAIAKHECPEKLNYTLYSSESNVCFMSEFAVSFVVTYTQENEHFTNNTVYINVDKNRKLNGNCSDKHNFIEITTDNAILSFNFTNAEFHATAYLNQTNVTLIMSDYVFPNLPMELTGQQKFTSDDLVFNIPVNSSMFCYANTKIHFARRFKDMTGSTNHVYTLNLDVVISQAQIEPFYGNRPFTGFSQVNLCQADKMSANVVPLTVGIVLVVLVVSVLTSYFIARSRTRSGYETVA
ncbi:hypothetical protein GJ496_006946 [Pomphorhynchus laevis]|nr:hypothetical protein GJ496_006946 [Pomphorhynchus laevis]